MTAAEAYAVATATVAAAESRAKQEAEARRIEAEKTLDSRLQEIDVQVIIAAGAGLFEVTVAPETQEQKDLIDVALRKQGFECQSRPEDGAPFAIAVRWSEPKVATKLDAIGEAMPAVLVR